MTDEERDVCSLLRFPLLGERWEVMAATEEPLNLPQSQHEIRKLTKIAAGPFFGSKIFFVDLK